jgi:uncharacterized membrane protein
MSNLTGSICTPEEQTRANTFTNDIYCLTRGQSIGLALTAEAGFISLVAVIVVFLLIAVSCEAHLQRGNADQGN